MSLAADVAGSAGVVDVVGVAGRDLRANSAYTLQAWDSVPQEYRQSLSATLDPASVAGVLVAGPGSALPDKVVGPGGAALFNRLQRPGRAADVPGRPARPARARRGSRDLDGRGVPVWPGRARAPARTAALASGRRPDRRAVTGRAVVRRAPPGRERRCADSQALRLRPGSSVRPVGPRLPGPDAILGLLRSSGLERDGPALTPRGLAVVATGPPSPRPGRPGPNCRTSCTSARTSMS